MIVPAERAEREAPKDLALVRAERDQKEAILAQEREPRRWAREEREEKEPRYVLNCSLGDFEPKLSKSNRTDNLFLRLVEDGRYLW